MSLRDRIATWNIIGKTKLWFTISIVIILVGIIAFIVNQVTLGEPLNFGIDFRGGTVVNITCTEKPDESKVKDILSEKGYKNAIVRGAEGNKILIKLSEETIKAEDIDAIVSEISQNVSPVTQHSDTLIAPVIGGELQRSGLIALGLALLFILFYITVRFAFQFALATVLALFHDVIITLGMLALFRVEINAPFIGAFLAIITYSVEDSVVVLDRIRENLKFKTRETFASLVNRSIQEVWIRSMNSSLTTFFAALALLLFGGSVLRDFSMTLAIGLLSGTYSSIYIASPLLVLWKKEKVPQYKVPRAKEEVAITVDVPELDTEKPVEKKTMKAKKSSKGKKKGKKR